MDKLLNPANPQQFVVIGAIHAGCGVALQYYPVHSETILEPLKIGCLEMTPFLLRCHFFQPSRRQTRHLGRNGWILYIIGKRTAFGQCAKTMEVLAGALHVIGIKSEVTVRRRVLTDPGKRLKPGILRNSAGELQVRRSRKRFLLRRTWSSPALFRRIPGLRRLPGSVRTRRRTVTSLLIPITWSAPARTSIVFAHWPNAVRLPIM